MRKEYEMTDNQFQELLEASKTVPYIVVDGLIPESPQEKANRVWKRFGDELGFDYLTVRPVHAKSGKFFTAEEI